MITKSELIDLLTEKCTPICKNDVLRIGTTGDYLPFTWWNEEKQIFEGSDIEIAEELALRLNAELQIRKTTWSAMVDELLENRFDLAIGGISITEERLRRVRMSSPYCDNFKTILCRKEDAGRFSSVDDIDRKEIRVITNSGGTNEEFAKNMLKKCSLIFIQDNRKIPELIAQGVGDVMISEVEEVKFYCRKDLRLDSSMIRLPFQAEGIGAAALFL